MKKFIGIAVICALLGIGSRAEAQVANAGGTTTTAVVANLDIMTHAFYTNFGLSAAVGTAAVYTEAGGTSSTSGWVDVRKFTDEINLEIVLPVMNAGMVTMKLEGRIGNSGTGSVLLTKTFTGTDSNYYTPVMERPDYVRAYLQSDTVGSESVSVRLKCINNLLGN